MELLQTHISVTINHVINSIIENISGWLTVALWLTPCGIIEYILIYNFEKISLILHQIGHLELN